MFHSLQSGHFKRIIANFALMNKRGTITGSAAPAGRDTALDVLRIAAAMAVVWLHASSQHFVESFPTALWTVRLAGNCLSRWCVPVFLMISGALFLDKGRKLSLGHLYGKNLLHIVVAFFIWSYVYSFQQINAGPWRKSLALLLQGPSHLWFLKMLAGIYIAVPVFRAVTATKQMERYFIVLAVATTFVVPFGFTLAKQHCDPAVLMPVKRFYDSLFIHTAAGYSGYFVLGHYLRAYPLPSRWRRWCYAAGLAATVIMIAGTIGYSHRSHKAVNWFINYLTPTVLAQAVAVFVLFVHRRPRLHGAWQRWVPAMARLSFGVYLVHVLFIRTAVAHGITSSCIHPALGIPLYTVGITAASVLTAWLLSKIPYARRFLL